MAIIALINLCLVLFDLSYLPWRTIFKKLEPGPVVRSIKALNPSRNAELSQQGKPTGRTGYADGVAVVSGRKLAAGIAYPQ